MDRKSICPTTTCYPANKRPLLWKQTLCCRVSVQGLHPLKDSAFVVFEGESFRDLVNLVTVSPLEHFLVASPDVLPLCYVISAAQVCESDDLHYAMSPFSLFLSSLSGSQIILGHVRPRRIVTVHPPKRGQRRSIWRSLQIGTAFTRRCDAIGLQMQLWRMQTLNWDTATVCGAESAGFDSLDRLSSWSYTEPQTHT